MRRWCFNILAAVTLLVCVATVGLWVRSYWVSDWLLWHSSDGWMSMSLDTYRGSLDFMRAENTSDHCEFRREPVAEGRCPRWPAYSFPKWNKWGFAYYDGFDITGMSLDFLGFKPIPFGEFVMPIWPFVLIFAMLPLLRCYLWFKLRRVAPGLCLTCGYDLRASKDRCSECGTLIPAGLVKEPIR